nr:DUF4226 domain-containing protein [Mycobacterium sp.]
MASHQDLLDAIARVGAATGDREAWQAGLSGEDIAAACSLSSQPTALTAVLTRIVAAHPEAFLPAAGPVSVRPGGGEGLAAEAVRDAETALAQQNSAAARADLQVVTAVLGAHGANADGVARLDRLQREIESAVLSRTDLDTPAGAREFQRFLIGKTRDIRAIVDSAGLDATSKAALATALASLYASATPLPAEASPTMAAESPPAQSVPSDPPIATAARGSAAGLAEPFTGDPPPWGLDDPPPVYEVPGGQIPAPPAAAVSLPAPAPGPAAPATPAPAMAAPGSGWGGGLPGFGGGLASPGFSVLGAPGFGGPPEGIRDRVGALRRERDSDPPDIPADATTDAMTDEPAPEEPALENPASHD